jgi:hypothetical protein
MKIYTAIIAVTLLFLTSQCFSQNRDSFLRTYNEQTIYRSGNKYTLGNDRLAYEDLGKEFTTPRTQELYRISKKRLGISRIFSLGSLAVIITSVFFKRNVWGSIEFAAGSGILSLGALSYQTQSSKFVDRAIWERNRDVLSASVQ